MARNKKITAPKEPPFHIDAVLDGDGYTYSVSPWSEDWLLAKFPHAKPKRCVFIAQDTKADFAQAHQRIAPFLLPLLLGLTESEVRALGDVPFTKPYPLEILFTWRASENTSKMPVGASAETHPTP
jgi:hypothetical protein